MCDRHNLATPRGNLQIPLDVRNNIFARLGLPPEKKVPRFSKCAVYFATPIQSQYVFAIRMFLSTDIFLHQEEFSPEDDALKAFMDMHPNTQGGHAELAREFVIDYLEKNYERILEEEIWKKYVRSL